MLFESKAAPLRVTRSVFFPAQETRFFLIKLAFIKWRLYMFWNVSGIILGIALVTTFAVEIVCNILAIPISIPVSLINALIVCYLIITNKKYTKKVLRFTMLCMFLAAMLGLIQVSFFKSLYSVLCQAVNDSVFCRF